LIVGNATADGAAYRGWFIGNFVASELGLRASDQVEIKWGTHRQGERRGAWAVSRQATSMSLLVRGAIRIFFEDGSEALLSEPGDYALWAPGVAHRWVIEQDETVILTVRWPSLAGDAVDTEV
jgi:quercetin dioxygenase-like cupin family protein